MQPESIPPADLQVATYWTTIEAALAAEGQALHYCQGYEGSYTHNQEDHPRIRAAYRQHLPAMAVAPHLAELLWREFRRRSRVVPQPLESFFRAIPLVAAPRVPPRILLMSPFEIDWKGVEVGLRAVELLGHQLGPLELVRISQWAQTEEERTLYEAKEFHCHLTPPKVADIMRTCDLLLAPSWEQEGFGLPVLEAMACGVPVVASDISAFRDFAGDAVTRVPWDRPDLFAASAASLLSDPGQWLRSRDKGLAVAENYRVDRVLEATEAALSWVLSGAWQHEQPGFVAMEPPDAD